jgi:RES domain
MVKFPEPPGTAELQALGIGADERRVVAAGTTVWRVYFRSGPHPGNWNAFRAWGPTNARFDHQAPPPGASDREILYAAERGRACLAEVFQDTRTIDRMRRRPWIVAFQLTRDVNLLDLTGLWPTRTGASQAISTGPRRRAQRWSRRIYEAFPDVEGLCYPSSMCGGELAYALYERAENTIAPTPSFHRALADPALLTPLEEAARRIGYVVV